MSRGPGRVEKTIAKAFAESPSATFSTDDLIVLIYPGVDIEKKHRVAVLRAADRVAARLHWEKWQCERAMWGNGWRAQGSLKGRGAVYLNPADVWSYARARLRTDFIDGAKTREEWDAKLGQGGDLHKFVVPGGAWWAWAEPKKTHLAGMQPNPDVEALVEENRKASTAHFAVLKGMLGNPSESDEHRSRRIETMQRRKRAVHDASICARCGRSLDPAEPIARDMVYAGQAFMGGHTTFVEVRCMNCAARRARYYERPCLTCGRPVHQILRRDRRRAFCCALHQRRWYRQRRKPCE
jgi:hypothetical protein